MQDWGTRDTTSARKPSHWPSLTSLSMLFASSGATMTPALPVLDDMLAVCSLVTGAWPTVRSRAGRSKLAKVPGLKWWRASWSAADGATGQKA